MTPELDHKRRRISPVALVLVVLAWPLSYGPLIRMHDAGAIGTEAFMITEATLYAPWVVFYERVPGAKAFGDWYIALWRM